ncbi:MAG TPA: MerR family transcriptional regulator [Actinomycetales bacterium]|nr:MerR family transcriptional regulator [Actinomycetales bacterium]
MSPAVSRRHESMSIGEVLALLTPDFPDVSISKIRLWETEGLVEPARTASGYRKFTHADVERLRYAMTLQRDRYWPLRRIREHLDAVARGAEEPVTGAVGPRPALASAGNGVVDGLLRAGPGMRLSADELCARTGLDAAALTELVGYGLLQPSSTGWYDEVSLAIATAAAELAAFGIGPRHLRPFRTAADREVGLVEQVVSQMRGGRDGGSRARADEAAREITAVALRLHAALVRAGLVRAGLA